jgi:hypothetical protein
MNPFRGFEKLFRSSTFWVGALANLFPYLVGGQVHAGVLAGSVIAYGLKEAGAYIGSRTPPPPPPVNPPADTL